jgi:F-type H+-transporting ATPase subunit b
MSNLSPDLSIALVMIMVYCLYFILKKNLFNPINRILEERDAAINGGQQAAQDQWVRCDELSQNYQNSIKKARMDSYHEQEKFRVDALKMRAQILADGRAKAEKQLAAAREETRSQVVAAKQTLETEVASIADGIVKAVLR